MKALEAVFLWAWLIALVAFILGDALLEPAVPNDPGVAYDGPAQNPPHDEHWY